ncbi:MAG TPA: aminotransferase class I/II-fold pyridoxal phosphate-dependent enzyme [Candidatus Acidoferrum sp.]|nr:aminotransferase class I/II-fold pyridoxal phosphate-dependent enzyme [Candidatus Acidoferrum sp.]
MSYRRTEARTAYIEWAKHSASAKYSLAASGVKGLPLSELPVKWDEMELSAPGGYGYAPLLERLAARYGVATKNVATAIGTSMANYLAMSAVLEPGDEVVIEQPAYDPMVEAARYLGAVVKRIPRRPENKFQIDVDELRKMVSGKTRLIVLTNLHNPTGVLLAEDALTAIGQVAARVGAYVMVDEVYLELLFDRPFRSAFHLGEHFMVTSSLTKAYGLSGLRCGWIMAAADLVQRMWHHNDLFGNIPAHITHLLSVVALDHLEQIRARAKSLLEANWKLLDAFLVEHPELGVVRPAGGTIVFAKVPGGDGDTFASRLHERYETSVVPGRFFELTDRIRIGICNDTVEVKEGLSRLGRCYSDFE